MEIWKDVKGYELYFKVSNLGRVLGKRSGKILKQHTNKNGRATLATRIGGRQGEAVTFFVHRLVALLLLKMLKINLKLIIKTAILLTIQ